MTETQNKKQGRKKVLFLNTVVHNISGSDPAIDKKFTGLSKEFDVYVIARGRGFGVERFGAHFYLFPRFFCKLNVFLWMVWALFVGVWLVLVKKIDVVITQAPVFDGPVGVLICKITRTRLIAELHGDFLNSTFFYFKVPFEKTVRKILTLLGRFSLGNADAVRGISTYTHLMLDKFAFGKPRYNFPTFTDIDMFYDGVVQDPEWKPQIVYVGWLYYLKGVHLLIDAFKDIKKRYPEFELVLVGNGPYEEELRKRATNISGIVFMGKQPLTKVKDIVREATVLVLPSYSEGLGRVLIEAQALKKPVVGSNIDGIPDLIQDGKNGYLFESGNVDDLREKLELIISDTEKAKKMGEYGYSFVRGKFATKNFFEGYHDMIYTDVTN